MIYTMNVQTTSVTYHVGLRVCHCKYDYCRMGDISDDELSNTNRPNRAGT